MGGGVERKEKEEKGKGKGGGKEIRPRGQASIDTKS